MRDARVFGGERLDPESSVDESPLSRRHFRSIWISDFHLGTARCKAESLLDFLSHHSAENLFMVGDVIDGWNADTTVGSSVWGAWPIPGIKEPS